MNKLPYRQQRKKLGIFIGMTMLVACDSSVQRKEAGFLEESSQQQLACSQGLANEACPKPTKPADITPETDTNEEVVPTLTVALAEDQLTNQNMTLTAEASPSENVSFQWLKASGPGEVIFSKPTSLTTEISADQDGTYEITFTITHSTGASASASMNITWDATPPVITAIDDFSALATVNLTASATDQGDLTYQWTKVSGSGAITFSAATGVTTDITADADDSYALRLIVTDTAGNSSEEGFTFTWDTSAPTVIVGSDITTNASSNVDASATDSTSLTYAWTQASGPGTLTFGGPSAEDTTISADTDGVYVARLTATDSEANSSFDELQFTWDTTVPSITSLADLTENALFNVSSSVTDLTGLTYSWTKTSGPGALTFSQASQSATDLSADTEGTYVVRLTATDTAGNSSFDEMTLVWDTTGPSVNAGADDTTNSQISQDATVSDANGIASYVWTKQSGLGNITFGTATAEDSTISADTDGTYVIRLTATDNAGNSTFDEMTLVWDATGPSVNAGADDTTNSQISQDATVSDANGIASYLWTKQSGPGNITFGSSTAEDSTISADVQGTYVIRLTVTDNAGNSTFDEMTLIWDTTDPAVNAGADDTTNSQISQDATVSDANGIASYVWTKQSGPGNITFGTATAEDSTISADTDGTYVIRLTATDNAGNSTFDEMTLVWDTTAPSVNAGADVLTNIQISQDATVSDAIGIGSYLWTKQSGPGNITFGTATAEDSTISADTDGTYVIRLTATDTTGNSAFDEMTLIRDTTPPLVNAGGNVDTSSQVSQDATVSDTNGISSYLWSKQSGPGNIIFGSATSEDTTITADTYGIYTLRLSATDQAGLSAFQDITFKWEYFSNRYDYTTPAGFVFDPAKVNVVNYLVQLVETDRATADNSASQFNLGTYSDTELNVGNKVNLDATGLTNGTGTFTSRVWDAGAITTWDVIKWTEASTLPYMADLPDSGGTGSGFNQSVDMTGVKFLLHMDDLRGSTTITDSSGYGHTGTCSGSSCPITGEQGFIGKGSHLFDKAYDTEWRFPHSANLAVSGDATFMAWVKMASAPTVGFEIFEKGYENIHDNYEFAITNIGGNFVPHFSWNDLTDGSSYAKNPGAPGALSVGVWHHVAVVFDDTNDKIYFYLDGQDVSSGGIATVQQLDPSFTSELVVGRANHSSIDWDHDGWTDEIAVIDDKWTSAQIQEAYLRGAVRLGIQTRGCADATCSTNPSFVGPDGTVNTSYSNTSGIGRIRGADNHRYAQYRVTYSTPDSSFTPELATVSLQGVSHTDPPLTLDTQRTFTSLTSFTEDVEFEHLGAIAYQLSVNNSTWYYHNGSNWVVGTNISQSNTAAEVVANFSSFPTDVGVGNLYIRGYFSASNNKGLIRLNGIEIEGINTGL